jgi:molybdopterin molybdotransferase
MPEFLKLTPPDEALRRLLDNLPSNPQPEEIDTSSALGRATFSPVIAPYPLPSFPRSTVDGYAVRAANTFGASEAIPAYLSMVGEAPMGATTNLSLSAGQCVLIHTGGMLPEGSDAVVMVEYTQSIAPHSRNHSIPNSVLQEVEIFRPVAPGENILEVGEDVQTGQEVIAAGTRLRPAEIGGLMALGITHLSVARRPYLGILSSGDEVISPEAELLPGRVRDANSYSLSALVEEAGGAVSRYGIVSDQEQVMFVTARRALAECDLLVITAGSSASTRDLTAQVINRLGAPGVLVHGVNVKPGKPTILAVCDGKAVIGLPGNPVSALVIASLFVVPVVEKLLGLRRFRPRPSVVARLGLNLPSQSGREEWAAVRLVSESNGYLAEPVFGKSNSIFTLVRADGLVHVPSDATGLSAEEIVEVLLL